MSQPIALSEVLGLEGTRVLHVCRKFYSEVQEDTIIMSEKKSETTAMIWEMLYRCNEQEGRSPLLLAMVKMEILVVGWNLSSRMNGVWKVLTLQE